jgi:UDP-N-acetyl-D-galactosamine dehydrogenase|tara:strand:+ start:7696 stop:8976 length:1281 start_codon:yes stop_codon:yes gene_type:complete
MPKLIPNSTKITVIGLGYVGLPLALAFSKKYKVVGFDINTSRVSELKDGQDSTNESQKNELLSSKILFTSSAEEILDSNFYIVTVPTPIDLNNKPDLQPLISASEIVANVINDGDTIIFESTVYPGATEEVCVPILEKISSLKYNENFFVGYSPERINPGDKKHRLSDIVKVTSGSNQDTLNKVDQLYASIISAGTYKASSIKVAEAAKVIENTQRDLNIALINELAIIFDKLEINTDEVLKAAETKWNFLPFKPGLVGGHCIGVDPYYLTHKSQQLGYSPEVILAGRKLNDSMGKFIAQRLIISLKEHEIKISNTRVLVMGLTFKENCPDLRNTKVVDVIADLNNEGISVDIYDPWVDKDLAEDIYNIKIVEELGCNIYDAIIIAVAHNLFLDLGLENIKKSGKDKHLIYDLKSMFSADQVDISL